MTGELLLLDKFPGGTQKSTRRTPCRPRAIDCPPALDTSLPLVTGNLSLSFAQNPLHFLDELLFVLRKATKQNLGQKCSLLKHKNAQK